MLYLEEEIDIIFLRKTKILRNFLFKKSYKRNIRWCRLLQTWQVTKRGKKKIILYKLKFSIRQIERATGISRGLIIYES